MGLSAREEGRCVYIVVGGLGGRASKVFRWQRGCCLLVGDEEGVALLVSQARLLAVTDERVSSLRLPKRPSCRTKCRLLLCYHLRLIAM